MARRKGRAAEEAIKKEKWNRWRILLRRPVFQVQVNRLRHKYQDWVKGEPVTDVIEGAGIARSDYDPRLHTLHPNDPLAQAWAEVEAKWLITLPKAALTSEFPDLTSNTIKDWEALPASDVIYPPVSVENRESGTPSRITLTIDLAYPHDVLIDRIGSEIQKSRLRLPKYKRRGVFASPRQRMRNDKITRQLEVYDLYAQGERIERIARLMNKPKSTVRDALQAAIGLIKGHPVGGKKWEKEHIVTCPRCRRTSRLDFDCPVARNHLLKVTHAKVQAAAPHLVEVLLDERA